MSQAIVVLHPDKQALATSIAEKVIVELRDILENKKEAHLVLTGGSIGIASLKEIAKHPQQKNVQWEKIHFWWGDERFIAPESEDRNAKQAYTSLLDHIKINVDHVYELPSTKDFATGTEAAINFNQQIQENFPSGPPLDLVLLGVGPDSHVASLFPHKKTLKNQEIHVLYEENSPKPPPARLTMSMPMLCSAHKVWCIVSGEDKAEAVAASLAHNADPMLHPASTARGQKETLWLIDQGAGKKIDP